MIACDRCHALSVVTPVARLRLAVLRPDPASGRVKPEELNGTDVELCGACVNEFWAAVAAAARPTLPPLPEAKA